MPVENGVGWGDHSEDKQNDFRSLLSLHINLVDKMTQSPNLKWKRDYTYIDMNAGPGCYNGIIGSPVAFLDRIEQTDIPYKATFIEQEPINAKSLNDLVSSRKLRGEINVINSDHDSALRNDAIPKAAKCGLIYHDPSGNVPSFDLLSDISRQKPFQYMEFLIYLSATNIKRVRRYEEAAGKDAKIKLLTQYLTGINKKIWIIRKPEGKHQWTFALGSNWVDFPAWEKKGFYSISSPEGRDILAHITYTANELIAQSGQLSFFNLPAPVMLPIETIKSI